MVLRNDSWKTGDTYHWGKQEIRSRFWFLEESGRPGLGMLLVRTWITQWDMFSLHVRREDCSSNRRRGLTYIDLRVLRFYIILKALMWQSESRSILSDSLWHHGLYSPWNSLGQTTGVGSLSLVQGIYWTQGSRIAGGLFTSWATREVLNVKAIPSNKEFIQRKKPRLLGTLVFRCRIKHRRQQMKKFGKKSHIAL